MNALESAQADLREKMAAMAERSRADLEDFERRSRARGSMMAVPPDKQHEIRRLVELLVANVDLIPHLGEYAQKLVKAKRLKELLEEKGRLEVELGMEATTHRKNGG